MPILDSCIGAIFEPGNIGSSTGTPPTVIIPGSIEDPATYDPEAVSYSLDYSKFYDSMYLLLLMFGGGTGVSGGTFTVLREDYTWDNNWHPWDYYLQPSSSWYAFNSPWGWYNAGSYHWWQQVAVDEDNFPNNTIMTWDWGPVWGGVMGYPYVGCGVYSANWVINPDVLLTSRTISALTTCTTTHNCTISAQTGTVGDFDVIYDYYLTTNPNGALPEPGPAGQGLFEISIFCHWPTGYDLEALYTSATLKGTVTDADGVLWRFFHVPATTIPARIIYYQKSPVLYGDLLVSKTIDHALLLQAAVTAGIATGNEYFNGIGFGPEQSLSQGTFTLVSISMNYP